MSDIGICRTRLKELFSNLGLGAVRKSLDNRLIADVAARMGLVTRERLFTPFVTMLCCVFCHLQGGLSLRKVEDWLFGFAGKSGRRYGKALSDARARLPVQFFAELVHALGLRALASAGLHHDSLRVVLVDGTTMPLARTPDNSGYFGHAGNQARQSCLPVARMLLMLCAGTGAAVHAAVAPYRTSEMALLLAALHRLPPQSLLLGDRFFGSWLVLWRLTQQGCHGLFQIHQTRKLACHAWHGEADYHEVWRRPGLAHTANGESLRHAPKELRVRVIRRQVEGRWLVLCTTLLDATRWPADELVRLHAARWKVELAIRHLKSDHLPAVVRAKSPDAVANEITGAVLAYTAVRLVMSQAGADPWRLSHARANALIVHTSERMREAPWNRLTRIYEALLNQIKQTRTELQPRAPCRRVLLPRRTRYPVHPDFTTANYAA